jgi:hypothetical protein
MKKILSFGSLAVITALLIVYSCQKSNDDTPENPTNPNVPIEYVTASITGRVVDDNNLPVNGAAVKAGTASTTTDIDGNFSISNVSLDKNAGFIKIEKDSFFTGSRTIVVNTGAANYVSVQLIRKKVSGTVSGSSGGHVTVQGGGSVAFTGNSFVNTAGNSAYTGTVSVSTFFINPAAGNFNDIMPGTLRGINTSNEETGLQSFGMMAVELTGAGGEKLQLASGETATLTFPIPTSLQAQAPATIPLWSFNDTTGLWKEEGVATKQGTNYVGTVGHFSFWNCDYPYGKVVDFKAVIKDQNGNPLFPAKVVLKISTDSMSSIASAYTDSTGRVSGKVPSNKTIQLNVYNKCNTPLYTSTIGPFSAATDLGTVTVNVTGPVKVAFTGTVINCNAAPVTNGFVDILMDNVHNRATVTNGSFAISIMRCVSTATTAVVTAYDLSANQSGAAKNVAVSSTVANAGQLSACGTSTNQFLNYNLNGTAVSFVVPADSITYSKPSNSNNISVYAQRKATNNYENVWLSFTATGTGAAPLKNAYIYYNQKMYILPYEQTVNITEFGPTGGYLSGNFDGKMKDSLSTTTVPVTFTFRVKK